MRLEKSLEHKNDTTTSVVRSLTTSYTRLSSFSKCPLKYKYAYIDKITENTIEGLEESLLIGSLTHYFMEEYLKGEDRKGAMEKGLEKWITRDCKLRFGGIEREGYIVGIKGLELEKVVEYAEGVGKIYRRCSESYTEVDAIRNTDRSVPKDPIKYSPAVVKKEINEKGLYNLALEINNAASVSSSQFNRLTLSELIGKAAFYFYNFEIPEWVNKTIGIELRFDDLDLKWKNGRKWLGGIDWVVESTDGAIVICDHKTEKEKTAGIDVLHHPQLNLYASLYCKLYGKVPDYIAINHLPSGTISIAKTDIDIMLRVVNDLEVIEQEIKTAEETNVWRKPLSPAEYNSPCLSRDWQTKAVSRVCKYFRHCWPYYAENIEQELKLLET